MILSIGIEMRGFSAVSELWGNTETRLKSFTLHGRIFVLITRRKKAVSWNSISIWIRSVINFVYTSATDAYCDAVRVSGSSTDAYCDAVTVKTHEPWKLETALLLRRTVQSSKFWKQVLYLAVRQPLPLSVGEMSPTGIWTPFPLVLW